MMLGRTNNFMFLLLSSLLMTSCGESQKELVLPIVGDRDLNYRMVDGKEVIDTLYHHVPAFEYLNQDSVMVSSKDLKKKIWVTDFFFAHCPSICPSMTANMKRLSVLTKDLEKHVQFLSFSIDPKRDTPSNLRAYIKLNGITATNWQFFTGDEDDTHLLAKEFFNGAQKDDAIPGGFGHTPYFALVDTSGLVRGIYDGTETKSIDKLEKDIRKLLKYEYNVIGSK